MVPEMEERRGDAKERGIEEVMLEIEGYKKVILFQIEEKKA
jgi:hypothetical protein